MIIVPVIDLVHGRAVLADRGRRDSYRPVDSPLCRDGAVLPLVDRLFGDFGFTHLYLADLDAIRGQGDHWTLIAGIAQRFPAATLWVDAGFRGPAEISEALQHAPFRPVVGSESWHDPGALPDRDCLLSVDRDAAGLRDPSGLAADVARHPRDLMLMNLERVGADRGPDLDWLQRFAGSTRRDARLFLAGGVRHAADLQAAQAAGAAGVLVASALHRQRIDRADLAAFS